MSAYIVSDNTIHALVKAFEIYGVELKTDYKGIGGSGWIFDAQEQRNAVGQRLVDQNWASVNYRYGESNEPEPYEYNDIDVTEGDILGCIQCYNYQACETDDYYEGDIYNATVKLRNAMLERFIKNAGQEICWGLD